MSGLILIAVLAIDKVGIENIHAAALEERPELLNLLMPAAIMFLFNNLLFGVGEIFHSNVWWSRAFSFREGVGKKAYALAGLLWAPIPIVAGFVALAVPALNLNVPAADMVGPMVAAKVLGTTGAVLVLIMVFSALSSSLDSLLAATSILVVEDIYRRHLKPEASAAHLRRATAWIIVGLGALTWLLCAPRITTLAELLYFTGAFVASTIWPIAAGLFLRNASTPGAISGMVLGSAAGLYSYFAIGFYVAALVGAAVSLICVVLGMMLKPAEFDWAQLANLGLTNQEVRHDNSTRSVQRCHYPRACARCGCAICPHRPAVSRLAEETLMVTRDRRRLAEQLDEPELDLHGFDQPRKLLAAIDEDLTPLLRLVNRPIVTARQFDRQQLLQLYRLAARFETQPQLITRPLTGKIMISAFYEPSTRTRLSFESAWHRLGGDIMSITDPASTGIAKGESYGDVAEMLNSYGRSRCTARCRCAFGRRDARVVADSDHQWWQWPGRTSHPGARGPLRHAEMEPAGVSEACNRRRPETRHYRRAVENANGTKPVAVDHEFPGRIRGGRDRYR